MRAVGTLTDPAAPNKIKIPHWDIFILSWLCYLCNSRAELLEIGQAIEDIKKKSITYSNDFIRISSANLSMSVVHPLHQNMISEN